MFRLEDSLRAVLAELATSSELEVVCELCTGLGASATGAPKDFEALVRRLLREAVAVPASREVWLRVARQFAGFAPSRHVLVSVAVRASGDAWQDVEHASLPLPAAPHDEDVAFAEGARLLVVSPSDLRRRVQASMAAAMGIRAVGTADQAEAVEHLRAAAQAGEAFDAVLVEETSRSGALEVVRAIALDPGLRARSIVSVGAAGRDRVSVLLAAGAAAVVSRPLLASDLRAALERAVPSVQEPARQPSPPPTTERLHVLLAEDDPVGARLARMALRRAGHDVVHVETGPAVLEAVRSSSFDVLLLDLGLPGMDGMNVARRIRAAEAATGTHLPIVALTAVDPEARDFARAGFDAALPKPLDVAALVPLVRRASSPRSTVKLRLVRDEVTARPATTEAIEFDDLRQRVGGDRELARELLGDFLVEGRNLAASLRGAAKAPGQLARVAHRARGALLGIGAPAAAKAAGELERAAVRGSDDEEIGGALADLLDALEVAVSAAERALASPAR